MQVSFRAIKTDIAVRLSEGASDRRSAMHTPVVATSDADVRVMVLRAFDRDLWTLRFHTDRRAPKAAVIGDGAPVGVLFYDRAAKIQIRARGVGRIEASSPAADAAWGESTNFAKRCYLGDGPGAASDTPTSGLPSDMEGVQPDDDQVAPARANFAILIVRIQSVDWFHLANSGHRRALFERDGDSWSARWIAP